MHTMYRSLRARVARREDSEKGFTLIELLVVVAIIAILVAIAIPIYLHYENSAQDRATQSDVRNAAVVVQECYSDNQAWPTGPASSTTSFTLTGCSNGQVNLSPSTETMTITADADGNGVTIGATSKGGGTYTFDTETGGSVGATTA